MNLIQWIQQRPRDIAAVREVSFSRSQKNNLFEKKDFYVLIQILICIQ